MNGLTAEYEFSDGVLTIRLRGEIDHHSVKYVREEIDRQILLLRSMRASRFQIFTKLVAPSNVPTLMATLKINVGMAWIGSIMGEYLVSKEGLGYLLVYGSQVFRLDLVMTCTIVLCALAGVMYAVVALLEKIVVKRF